VGFFKKKSALPMAVRMFFLKKTLATIGNSGQSIFFIFLKNKVYFKIYTLNSYVFENSPA
jgi:hypothetical protein